MIRGVPQGAWLGKKSGTPSAFGRALTPSVKTTKAYIASLGTSGVLISSFLLLLTVGSAIVAFNGIPGTGDADGLERVEVERESGDVSLVSADASDARARAREETDGKRAQERAGRDSDGGGSERAGIDRRGSGAGGTELGGSAPGTSSPTTDGGGQADGGGAVQLPQTPDLPSAGADLPSAGDVTGGVGGTVEQVGGGVGGTVGGVAPQVGGTVTETGQTVGGTVDGAGQTVDQTVDGLPSLP